MTVVGVAPEAKIIAIKAIDSKGRSTDALLAEAVLAAFSNPNLDCRVINMSWRTIGYATLLKEAINSAYGSGIVLVAAARNQGWSTPRTLRWTTTFKTD